MMKRLITVLCLSSTLLAISPAKAEWEGNWLFGVSAGFGDFDGDIDLTYAAQAPGRQVSLLNQNLDQTAFIWGLLFGYQVRCNGWLFGAELSFDWRNEDETVNFAFTDVFNNGWMATANYDQDVAVGITARAGYEVNDWFMAYIRLGLDTSNDSLSYISATSNNLLGAAVGGSRRQYRFLGGIGAEMPIPILANLSFRLEYNYLSKGKGVDASGFASDNLTFVDLTARVDSNLGKASFVYNFF